LASFRHFDVQLHNLSSSSIRTRCACPDYRARCAPDAPGAQRVAESVDIHAETLVKFGFFVFCALRAPRLAVTTACAN
jgi:hypothetical protein